MFDEKMSGSELVNEYHLDLPELQELTLRYDCSGYVQKLLDKNRKESSLTITKLFSTSRNNRYIGIISYHRKCGSRQGRWSFSSIHIGIMDTPKGMCAIAFYSESKQALKFTAHFFERYRERFGAVCDWRTEIQLRAAKTADKLISTFIKRNRSITWIETKSVFKNKVHIFSPIEDGIALIQWDKEKKLLQANTFITEDMLDDKQSLMVGYAESYKLLSQEERGKYGKPDFSNEMTTNSIDDQSE